MLTPKYSIRQYTTGRAEFKLARVSGHQCHSQRHRNRLGLQTHTASSSLRDQQNNNNSAPPPPAQSFLCFMIVFSGSSSHCNSSTLLMRILHNQQSAWVKKMDPARVGTGWWHFSKLVSKICINPHLPVPPPALNPWFNATKMNGDMVKVQGWGQPVGKWPVMKEHNAGKKGLPLVVRTELHTF